MKKEISKDTFTTYKILYLIAFDNKDGYLIYIGSNEINEWKQQDTFLIDVECCYHIRKSSDWPEFSKKIRYAWTFDKTTLKIIKLNPKKISRIWEGFY